MHTRSRNVEIPSGRSLPLAFGMNTRRIGSGRYVSSFNACASSPSQRSSPYASMSANSWPSTPGAPRFAATPGPGMRQDIRSINLVVQRVEANARLRLRFRVQRHLQLLDTFRQFGQVAQSPRPRHLLRSSRTEAPSLHRRYPASSVLQASPPSRRARPVRHRRPVDRPRSRIGTSRVACAFLVYVLSPLVCCFFRSFLNVVGCAVELVGEGRRGGQRGAQRALSTASRPVWR